MTERASSAGYREFVESLRDFATALRVPLADAAHGEVPAGEAVEGGSSGTGADHGPGRAEAVAEELAAQVRNSDVKVVLLGPLKAGKSTFMNVITGDPNVSQVTPLPAYLCVVEVRGGVAGDGDEVRFRDRDGEITWSSRDLREAQHRLTELLERWMANPARSEDELDVATVETRLEDGPRVEDVGVSLFDTPGLFFTRPVARGAGKTGEHYYSEITRRTVGDADVIVYVVRPEQLFLYVVAESLAFLLDKAETKRIFLVVNASRAHVVAGGRERVEDQVRKADDIWAMFRQHVFAGDHELGRAIVTGESDEAHRGIRGRIIDLLHVWQVEQRGRALAALEASRVPEQQRRNRIDRWLAWEPGRDTAGDPVLEAFHDLCTSPRLSGHDPDAALQEVGAEIRSVVAEARRGAVPSLSDLRSRVRELVRTSAARLGWMKALSGELLDVLSARASGLGPEDAEVVHEVLRPPLRDRIAAACGARVARTEVGGSGPTPIPLPVRYKGWFGEHIASEKRAWPDGTLTGKFTKEKSRSRVEESLRAAILDSPWNVRRLFGPEEVSEETRAAVADVIGPAVHDIARRYRTGSDGGLAELDQAIDRAGEELAAPRRELADLDAQRVALDRRVERWTEATSPRRSDLAWCVGTRLAHPRRRARSVVDARGPGLNASFRRHTAVCVAFANGTANARHQTSTVLNAARSTSVGIS